MKIVGDKLSYLDERNKKLGYEITGGKTRKKSPVMDFTAGCGKNKKKLIYDIPSKVHSESFSNIRVDL